MKADDFSGMLPAFQPRDFFTGRMVGWVRVVAIIMFKQRFSEEG